MKNLCRSETMNKYITTSVERTDNELKIKENEIGSILEFCLNFQSMKRLILFTSKTK